MQYQEILHRCFRCGYCKLPGNYTDINCPAYLKYRFETFAPGGRLWLIRGWLDGKIETSRRLQEILFSCATCRNCVEHCAFPKFREDILHAFTAAKEMLIDEGSVPPGVRDYLTRLFEHGNPYKIPQKKRGDWATDIDVAPFRDQEYLLYIGDVGSFDERAQHIARAVANALRLGGLSFGILGPREASDGNDAHALGEIELFKHVAEKNLQTFNDLGVRKVITLSPHAYNAMRNDYPALGGQQEVWHYTQILRRILNQLPFPDSPSRTRITYHDPCYLGRHNREYEAPREILRSIPGLELVEMERCKQNALCCGGGGGNFFSDIVSSGSETSAKSRVREAAETNARILATSCPICTVMLEDALKSENLDHKIEVKEISEIIWERVDPSSAAQGRATG